MIFSKTGLEIFIHRHPIDMRFGFHKLTGLVREKHGMPKILDGHVFMFFGNNRTRLKVLFFDGTGLCLLSKRIEHLLAALEPALRACAVAGYRQVFLYNVPSRGKSRGLSAAFLDDRRLSLILVAVAEGAGGAAREVVLGLLSRLEAGGFLSTASSRNLFEIPRSVEAVRVRGKPYREVIAAHEGRLLKEKRRVVPMNEAGVVTVITEVQQLHLDANVARGIYVPASADDLQRCEQSR